ncbi:cytidylyltransferase domain-containing protein [Elusimicrobiota bacterium]
MKIAIIPARGGSKRIKNKNIADFCGKPIIYYPLMAAKQSGLFDKIHVSTDSETTKTVVENLGFPVDFLRDPMLADDHTHIRPVLKWVLERYRKTGCSYNDVCLILPCAALIEASDLAGGFKAYLEHGREKALLAITEYSAPIEWAYEKDGRGFLMPCQPGKFAIRSQDLGKKYHAAGAFIFFNADHILSGQLPADQNYAGYALSGYKAVDIDEMKDFELAEILYLGQRAHCESKMSQ